MNRTFRVNGIEGIETHIEILDEVKGGYDVRISSFNHAGMSQSFEFISDELLESCLRTGYLVPEENPLHARAVLTA